MAAYVSVQNLHKHYRKRGKTRIVLSELNFELEQGKSLAVRGPNGAGKSTLLRLLCGLAEPQAGSITIGHLSVDAAKKSRRISALFEGERSFYWRLTVEENLRFFAALHEIRGNRFKERLQQHLNLWGLEKFRSDRFETLSAGNKKRVSLARTFLADSPLILLDDPLTALDSHCQETLITWIQQKKSQGVTFIFSSCQDDALNGIEDQTLHLQIVA